MKFGTVTIAWVGMNLSRLGVAVKTHLSSNVMVSKERQPLSAKFIWKDMNYFRRHIRRLHTCCDLRCFLEVAPLRMSDSMRNTNPTQNSTRAGNCAWLCGQNDSKKRRQDSPDTSCHEQPQADQSRLTGTMSKGGTFEADCIERWHS